MTDEIRAEETDLSTEDGFTAALARAAGVEVPSLSEGSGDEAPEAPAAEESQPRDESGRFVAREPEATPAEDGAAPAAETQQEENEPQTLADLLLKHGGDAKAALEDAAKQVEASQSHIGAQGNELGELRAEVARLQGQLEGFTKAQESKPEPAPQMAPIPWQSPDHLEADIMEHGGEAVMGWTVENRPDMIDSVIDAWYGVDPQEARRFERNYERFLAANKPAEPASPQSELVAQMELERSVATAMDKAKAGIPAPLWDQIESHLVPALEAAPEAIQQMIVDSDSEKQLVGAQTLVQLASARAIAAASRAATDEGKAAATAGKQAAMVATGSLRPVDERQPGGSKPETSEERVKAFKEALLSTDTTSIAEGLREGR